MLTSVSSVHPQALRPAQTPPSETPPSDAPPPQDGWLHTVVEKAVDFKEAVSLLIGGSVYLRNKKKALAQEEKTTPLTDVPNVRMHRPLVMCPGWNTELHKFDYLADKLLASGENGAEAVYLKQGQAYRNAECNLPLEQIPSNTKIFINIWDDRKTPPHLTAPQLQQNLELVHQALGPEKVDLLGYSMGGLCGRQYLANGGNDIANFMTLGTPHQGTRFAQMSDRVIRNDVAWAVKFAGLSREDLPAMHWLAADSPRLAALNSDWPQQRARVDNYLAVGGRHEMTPAVGRLPWRKGDGLVESDRCAPPGEQPLILENSPFLHHGALPHDSAAFRAMTSFFGFEIVPGSYDGPLQDFTKPVPDTPYGEI